MIYFGTDDGIYRWFAASPWPIFHGLQHHAIAAMASQGGGTLAALDGSGRVWETADNGLSWRESDPPEGAGRPSLLAMAGQPPAIWLATRPLRLHRKILGRPGWSPLASPASPQGTAAPSARVLARIEADWYVAIDGAGLWRSEDNGETWEPCPGLPAEVHAVRGRSTALYAATSEGCRFSPDGGKTWEARSGGMETARHVRALEAHPAEPGLLLAGAAAPGGPGFRLYESKDGGKAWTHVKRGFPETLEFDQIADIRFDPADPEYAIVALSSGECWHTRNGGDWWEPIARQIKSVRVLCAVE